MLDAGLKTQLKAYLERLTQPVEMVASLDDSDASREMQGLLEDLAAASPLLRLETTGNDGALRPSFALRRAGVEERIRFAGLPLGHEFSSLVLALLQVGGHPPKADPAVMDQVRHLEGEFRFETFISLSCQNCPDVVQALNLMAVLNPNVRHTMIDGALFQEEVERRGIMAVPAVFLNGQPFGQGRMSLEDIVSKLDVAGAGREAERLSAKAPFDVLVVGGGPAGAAAAIYAARKGIRTGIAAERLGSSTRSASRTSSR
jgi:alkyl hydroperoxide reductase subunit F